MVLVLPTGKRHTFRQVAQTPNRNIRLRTKGALPGRLFFTNPIWRRVAHMILWLSLFWGSLLLPFHAFPFPDLPNDLFGLMVAGLLFCVTAFQSRNEGIYLPYSSVGLLLILLATVGSITLGGGSFYLTGFTYVLFLLSALLLAISLSQLKQRYGGEMLVDRLAASLVWIAAITALYGLLRYYGLLKLFIPWISGDGDRLIGPLNHANLTALVLALGIISGIYLLIREKLSFFAAFFIMAFFSVAASLAGSRSFVAFVLLPLFLSLLKFAVDWIRGRSRFTHLFNQGTRVTVLIGAVLSIAFLYPQVDKPISSALVESGWVDRASDETLTNRFSLKDGYRAEEWKKVTYYEDIADTPWFGFGPGRYGVFSLQADQLMENPVRMGTLWSHSHNIFTNILVELGYLGLFALMLMLGYLFYLFWSSRFSPQDFFVFSALGALFINNLVEFSFWFFGFLALGVSAVILVDKHWKFRFSTPMLPMGIGLITLCTVILSGAYVGKDYWSAVKGFHKASLSPDEQTDFLDARHNQMIGGDAYKAQIIRENPSLFAVDWQLSELERYIHWRPEMVYLMRYSSLLAAKGEESVACAHIERTVSLFPKVAERLVEELNTMKALGATFDVSKMHSCVADGMMYWVGLGQGETEK